METEIDRLISKRVLKTDCTFKIIDNNETPNILRNKTIYLIYKKNRYDCIGGAGFFIHTLKRKGYWSNKRFFHTELKQYVARLPEMLILYGVDNAVSD